MSTALRDFHMRHSGIDLVVCGCGPSLLQLPEPQRYVSIGVNDVGRLFDPTYLVVLNPRQQFKHDRFRYVEQSNAQALFTQIELGRVRPPVVRFRLGQYAGTDAGADDALHYTQNSPYVAVSLAAYMGARRIGLIGVDFTDDHFFAATGRHALAARLKEIDGQYGKLAAALARRGTELLNLSAISRLNSLPRARVDDAGEWLRDPATLHRLPIPTPPSAPTTARPRAPARSPSMKVAIEKRTPGLVGDLFETLAGSIAALGHNVSRDPRATARNPRVLSIVWNGRGHSLLGPVLYCEHGWLPRADYQISPRGINADSHAAPFVWDGQPLSAEQDAALDLRLAAIKSTGFSGYYQYMQANREHRIELPAQFLLVPLQIESDTNIIRHAPSSLRTMQALIDHVSRLDPPWPVIFKQHPADARTRNRHLRLQLRRKQDLLWPQTRGNIHEMLRSGACRGILTLNSNVAHDGLLWNVPAIVLGRNVWPRNGAVKPFLTEAPRDWALLADSAASAEAIACRRAYAQHLIAHQCSLGEAADPQRVATLLELALRERPMTPTGTVIPRTLPRAVARKTAVSRPPSLPTLNVVAENKGWLFEHWKQALAAAPPAGYRIAATQKPLPQAEAWIFLRAREAARSPDPMRSVVQLHDMSGVEAYRRGGVRADVARCGGLVLAHPDQQAILAASGIDLSRRQWIVRPVGWGEAPAAPPNEDAAPVLAWIGRPANQQGRDASGLTEFIAAVQRVRSPMRIKLIGERLDAAAASLRRAGIDCTVMGLAQCPLSRCAEWVGRFDGVVVTSTTDCGPWPLFDAVRAGVPVVATRVGWAERLLGDGRCGHLVDDVEAMAQAIEAVVGQRSHWRERRLALPPQCPEYGMAAWVEANLQLAVALAAGGERAVA
ncbi:glycosyltransferase [Lysobacter sp. CA196]|uniref:glycosyltransferase n=1 Tax=Lysobacter sp. CA196 TaxID=3455606 RepID=UPI003F8D885A